MNKKLFLALITVCALLLFSGCASAGFSPKSAKSNSNWFSSYTFLNKYTSSFYSKFPKKQTCTETDNGRDYFTRGWVIVSTLPNTRYLDSCTHDLDEDVWYLYETYCDGANVETETIVCPYGCKREDEMMGGSYYGACIDEGSCVEPYAGMVISEDTILCSGTYNLTGWDKAISITGSDLQLTCLGTKIIGSGSEYGIFIWSTVKNVTIRGCELDGFSTGIAALGGVDNITIENVSITNVEDYFINIVGAAGVHIKNSRFEESENTGVFCQYCQDGTIENNYYENHTSVHESPIGILYSNGMTVKNNEIHSLGGGACNGLWVFHSNYNMVRDNYVEVDGTIEGDGSHVEYSSNNIFKNNVYKVLNGDEQRRTLDVIGNSNNNQFYGNAFYYNDVYDSQGTGNIWCVEEMGEDIGNYYLHGAQYQGNDPDNGTCPGKIENSKEGETKKPSIKKLFKNPRLLKNFPNLKNIKPKNKYLRK